MANFTFRCPQCGQNLQCEERDCNLRICCPFCRAEFVPADMQMKKCRHCGKMIRGTALKCQYCGEYVNGAMRRAAHATGESATWWRNLLGILLIAALFGAGWFGWQKYQSVLRMREQAAALERQRQIELIKQAQLEKERRLAAERARLAKEARLREEAEAARKKQLAEENARREIEEAKRREAEKKARAEEEMRRYETAVKECQAFNAGIDKQIAALEVKLNAAKIRLQIKQRDLDRAREREKNSESVSNRRSYYRYSNKKNAYRSSNSYKALEAAQNQREDVERDYQERAAVVKNIEDEITALKDQKKALPEKPEP